ADRSAHQEPGDRPADHEENAAEVVEPLPKDTADEPADAAHNHGHQHAQNHLQPLAQPHAEDGIDQAQTEGDEQAESQYEDAGPAAQVVGRHDGQANGPAEERCPTAADGTVISEEPERHGSPSPGGQPEVSSYKLPPFTFSAHAVLSS